MSAYQLWQVIIIWKMDLISPISFLLNVDLNNNQIVAEQL